ncbi:MAG TPA: PLP-dependent aminotransferase family protein [Blastocatellia bacterium]|nr:PLP-dependent aminotransferase family protein [Blastocatellia bacterium]
MLKLETDYDSLQSQLGRNLRPNAIRNLTKLLGRSDVISLAAGAPSPETFPLEELAEISARVIRDRGQFALQYGPTRGQGKLVEQVVQIMKARGVENADPSEVVMTTGSQQGLDLIARLLLDPGDVALVELPSYIGGTIALHNAQAELVGVRQDDAGIDIEHLRRQLRRLRVEGRKVKCLYTTPNFQNPSGVTLAGERRMQLIDIAAEYDMLIIEDDAYYELFFRSEARRPSPLAALDPSRVVYLSSFSKVLAPGIRCAWIQAPELLSSRIELAKEGADLSSSVLDQAIVSEALDSGLIASRLPALREFYELRCHAMLDALKLYAPAGARWTVPAGGFFILMHVGGDVDTTDLLPQAIEEGVAYVPGQPFFVDGSGTDSLRLAFSKESPERIAQGIEKLCRAIAHN